MIILVAGIGAERERGEIGAEGELADGVVVRLQRHAVVARLVVVRRPGE